MAASLAINLIGAIWLWHSIRNPPGLPAAGSSTAIDADGLAQAEIGLERAVFRLRQALTIEPYDAELAATAASEARFRTGQIAQYHRSAALKAIGDMSRGDREILADRLEALLTWPSSRKGLPGKRRRRGLRSDLRHQDATGSGGAPAMHRAEK